jgi:hypothetical protein
MNVKRMLLIHALFLNFFFLLHVSRSFFQKNSRKVTIWRQVCALVPHPRHDLNFQVKITCNRWGMGTQPYLHLFIPSFLFHQIRSSRLFFHFISVSVTFKMICLFMGVENSCLSRFRVWISQHLGEIWWAHFFLRFAFEGGDLIWHRGRTLSCTLRCLAEDEGHKQLLVSIFYFFLLFLSFSWTFWQGEQNSPLVPCKFQVFINL